MILIYGLLWALLLQKILAIEKKIAVGSRSGIRGRVGSVSPGPGSAAFGARFPRARIHQASRQSWASGPARSSRGWPPTFFSVDFSVASSLYQLTEVRRDDTWLPSDDTRRRILLPSSIYTSRWKATFLQPYSLRCFSIFSKYVIPVLWKRSKQCNVT